MPNKDNISAPTTVISSPRSGSTLISEMFKLHPTYNSVGETGNLICDSWHSVEFARGITIPTIENRQILSTEEKAGRIVRQTFLTLFPDNKQEWFQKPIGLPKALSQNFDETQWDEAAEWYWGVYKHAFPHGKLFTLLRNPCDVVLSTTKHLGFDPASTWWTLGYMAHLLTHPACPIDYAVHYEVLVENQEAVVKNLFGHLDVPFDPAVMQAFKTVHIPSRGRENMAAGFSSRQAEWNELDPSIINPFYIKQINKLFDKFGYKVHWPDHFKTFQPPRAASTNSAPDPANLLQTIDRLNRNIESIHLDYSTKQIDLNHKLFKANQQAEIGWQTAKNLQTRLDDVLHSRAGRWLTAYWNTANKIKATIGNEPIPTQAVEAAVPAPLLSPSPSAPPQKFEPRSLSIDMTRPKSAVFVLPSGFTLGGVTSWSMEMSRQLNAQKIPAALIKYRNIGSALSLAQEPTGQILYCDGPQIPAEREVATFTAEYAKALPGTVIPNYNHRTYAVCAAISQEHANALRLIGYAHTDEDSYYALLFFYESIIHRFIAVSDEIGEKLRQIIPHREKDIIVRPYGVAVSNDLNRNYSPADEPLQITYAGRISTVQKRILDLVLLAEHLAQLGVNFQLNIVGDGSEKADLEQRVAALPTAIQQSIALKEPVAPDQMSQLWADSDICVLVSEYEGTSISLLESMAQGCVPVVTEVSGVQAVLINGTNGFFAPVGKLERMAILIQNLDKEREQLAAVGQQAHQAIKDRYSYEEYLAWFIQLTETVWQETPKSWPTNKPTMANWEGMKQLGEQLRNKLNDQKLDVIQTSTPSLVSLQSIEKVELIERSPFFFQNMASSADRNQFILNNLNTTDDFPTPPHTLMEYGESSDSHLKQGKSIAKLLRDALEKNQIDIESFETVLEFGCSNGRVLRHFADLARVEGKSYWGCDINANTVLWAMENLSPPFNFFVSTTLPNLPIEQGYFDFIYAISIFTHMDVMLFSWLLELKRIIKPGGYAYLTFLDEVSVAHGLKNPSYPIGSKVAAEKELFAEFTEGKKNMVVIQRDTRSMTFVRREFILTKLTQLFEVVSVHERVVANHQTAYLLKGK